MVKGVTPSESALAPGPACDAGEEAPLVRIIVLNYNGAQLTLDCVDSALKIDYPNFRVIVVDNASTDDSVVRFREAFTGPRVDLLVNDKNEGYAGGNNRGIERALSQGADYIFVLNNDTIADPGCLAPLVQAMETDPRIGLCAGPIFAGLQGMAPARGEYMSLFTARSRTGEENPANGPVDVHYVSGAALLLRSEALRRIGTFNESYFLLYEDNDICFRARKGGFRVCYVPSSGLTHLGHASLVKRPSSLFYFHLVRNRAWFVRRYGRLPHRLAFVLYSFCYFYPRLLLGRLYHGDISSARAIASGIWDGHVRSVDPIGDVYAAGGRDHPHGLPGGIPSGQPLRSPVSPPVCKGSKS